MGDIVSHFKQETYIVRDTFRSQQRNHRQANKNYEPLVAIAIEAPNKKHTKWPDQVTVHLAGAARLCCCCCWTNRRFFFQKLFLGVHSGFISLYSLYDRTKKNNLGGIVKIGLVRLLVPCQWRLSPLNGILSVLKFKTPYFVGNFVCI